MNQKKSCIGSPTKLKFLGFSLYPSKGETKIRAHEQSLKRFKDKIRKLTARNQGRSIETIMLNLRKYTTGWLGYYAIAEMKSAMLQLTGWIRRRIRQIYWKQWKRIWPKYKNLR